MDIGTLRGEEDYTSLNRPYKVLIVGIMGPCPPSPYPPKGPYDMDLLLTIGAGGVLA